ncbi:MAG: 4-hydroxybenzoate polyprenyltransferase [Flavobacteriales bacterium]|jgi:4-hydroxybenzoate polyprenyltransferase
MTVANSERPFVVESLKTASLRSSLPFLALLYSMFFLSKEEQFTLIPAALLSTFYVGDLFFRKRDTGLRSIPFIKIFLIAFVWTVVTVWFPLTMSYDHPSLEYIVVSFERFFFIMAITIPFDIRDLGIDSKGLRTIPQILGEKKAKWLSIFFLLGAATFSGVLFYLKIYGIQLTIGAVLFYILTLILIAGSGKGKSDYYYSFWIEGTMLAWGALLLFY